MFILKNYIHKNLWHPMRGCDMTHDIQMSLFGFCGGWPTIVISIHTIVFSSNLSFCGDSNPKITDENDLRGYYIYDPNTF